MTLLKEFFCQHCRHAEFMMESCEAPSIIIVWLHRYGCRGVTPAAGFACQASVQAEFSFVMLGQTLLGAALYWWAGPLSHSMPFRLSAGSLSFMALSALILIFVLSRCDLPWQLLT